MAKKSKAKSGKPGAFSPKQIRENAAKTLKETCDKLVGPGYFEKFSAFSKEYILNNHHPAVRIQETGDKMLDKICIRSLKEKLISTVCGGQISLVNYLREGTMLIQYVEIASKASTGFSSELIEAFRPYFHEDEKHQAILNDVALIMLRLALIQSDWAGTVMSFDLSGLCAVKGITAPNQVPITYHHPEKISLQLDGHKRELLRIGWPEPEGIINWISIPPAKLGFFRGGNDEQPVYIQRHALNRLEERLCIYPGIIQEAISDVFIQKDCNWRRFNEKTLVPLFILNKKIGYLVISLDQEKIIIRSFLFLTNNGTPEGNQLSRITNLAPLDKKYLDMDTLPGFAGFDFQSHPELSTLFGEAGCEDLLDLEDLLSFSESITKKKDPDELMKYLRQYKTQ